MADARRFRWIVGIENAFIPDMGVDELTWTRHRERWREDLALARDLGVDAVRYGLTWPEVETAPRRYEWRAVDAVIEEFERIGVEPIWDLVHFGVPSHYPGGFLDPAYPEAFAAYAEAFAARYRGVVPALTPLNEPYITTLFRAGKGIWPPYLRGDHAFATMLRPIVDGLRRGIRAVDRVAPDMAIWLNDGADTFHPATPDLADEADARTLQRYAAFDLLLGTARPGEPTFEALVAAGYPRDEIVDEPVRIDVIGLDYYPETEHELRRDQHGDLVTARAPRPDGLLVALRDYHRRYALPLFVAESSASGDDATRRAWIEWNVAEMRAAVAEGVDVVGYTWWPLFDHVDWDSLLTDLRGNVCPAGLYHLEPGPADRTPTDAASAFREAAAAGIEVR